MDAKHIHIKGIVQGVGFRPFVYRLAMEKKICGWVNNSTDGVHIHAEGKPESLKEFIYNIRHQPPKLSYINCMDLSPDDVVGYSTFQIRRSEEHHERSVLLTPDYAMCPDCERELFDPENRRYRYPFITCTLCGPRVSITRKIPYDRSNTVMDSYTMCPACRQEYDQVFDRRFYSQTNSCKECGFHLSLFCKGIGKTEDYTSEQIIRFAIEELGQGKIIGVKGIGGYLLLCDATNPEAVRTLRKRKSRPSKPFALIYPDTAAIYRDLIVSDEELAEYHSAQAPIVLLRKRASQPSGLAAEAIAPGLGHMGVMKPYAPLLAIITHDFQKPVVATSGNVSGSPIIFDDNIACRALSDIADCIVSHDREILIPEDDSVLKITEKGRRIILRRSRGYAPNYLNSKSVSPQSTLALGASMKSTFSIQQRENTYVSQYLGDQRSYDSQVVYERTLNHFLETLDFQPDIILRDLHPGYATSALADQFCKTYHVPSLSIQHHEAHFAAVLAENELVHTREPVLGIIWDGTGYGTDSQIWGGEFIVYSDRSFHRVGHLEYYPHILGDKMPAEPRLSALSILSKSEFANHISSRFSGEELQFYLKLLAKNELQTSSMGRLFDAAASILGLIDRNTFEGEAAMLLEELAVTAGSPDEFKLPLTKELLSPVFHLEQIIYDLEKGIDKHIVAWNFHYRLVQLIRFVSKDLEMRKLAFSGGVFQNGLLVDLIEQHLGGDHELYFHQLLSPNDENISFGQLIHQDIRVGRKMLEKIPESIETYNS